MTDEASESSEVFDIDRVRELIKLMREFDLNEIDLKHSPRRIRLRRGAETIVSSVPTSAFAFPAAAPALGSPGGASPSAESATSAGTENAQWIKSPMVGTFYARPKPDKPPFVNVGDHVQPDTIVCIVEAMKMFNEIPAGLSGRVVEVCIKDGEPVDVNKPMFKVVP
jgi:acetyl-CoA carboxylase biotin carboxyl carrier protein